MTRRDLLTAAVMAGMVPRVAIGARRREAPTSITPVNFAVPPGACDCHTHIHGDPKTFPMFAGRVYTPPTAFPEEQAALHKALRIQRVVIVTPSIYGTDNAATLYGIKARGNDARGVAVIDDKTSERDLDALHAGGIRGIRLNLATAGINDPAVGRERLRSAITRVANRRGTSRSTPI
jgi:predicted TIM-barrel fold metal-dependent hydrolase